MEVEEGGETAYYHMSSLFFLYTMYPRKFQVKCETASYGLQ